ncbi:MAG: hypothetical protein K2F81_02600 [Ruminococcus sp.]|nr:hypothetical protein [Ruminococcus sp.]
MKTFKYYFTISCISFTFVLLVDILLNLDSLNNVNITFSELMQLFVCTSLIALLMFFTDKLDVKTIPGFMLVDILDICAVMYIFGMGLFRFITPSWENVLVTFGIIVAVYFLTFAVMVFDDRNAVRFINNKLEKMNGDEIK